ncbi:MAG: hypothetical protein FJ144_06725 [Deltaproteobacteria bacterium]|nr:hypothetical protein [Deltaproteobacteria bacterium]
MRPAHVDEYGEETTETAAATDAAAPKDLHAPVRGATRRRHVLLGALAAFAGGGAGVAFGYRYRTQLRALKLGILA